MTSSAMESPKRIAINIGGGYVPGLNAVIAGTVMAAHHMGWNVVGIRDGFDGLLFPDRYPDGGTVLLTPKAIGDLYRTPGVLLGTATPIQTQPQDLWDLIGILHQGELRELGFADPVVENGRVRFDGGEGVFIDDAWLSRAELTGCP